MISPYEVPALIAGKLPQIKNELSQKNAGPTVYQSLQALTDYTKKMALEHNFKMMETCMFVVQQIYKRGNIQVKTAVENVFIFAFSSILPCHHQIEWQIVQSCMPPELYALYVQQVLKSKC